MRILENKTWQKQRYEIITLFRLFDFIASKTIIYLASNLSILSVSGEGYFERTR
jgi:hypothetical protein